jgi:hypothetical protein
LWGNNQWQQLGGKYKNLLALITLCRGLSKAQLQAVQSHRLSCFPESIDLKLLQILSSKVNRDEELIFEGLEPDILGEYFLLSQFDKLSNDEIFLDGSEQLIQLLRIAWDVNWKGVGPMSFLIISDFENEFPEIINKLKAAKPLSTSDGDSWIMWGMFQVLTHVDPTATDLGLELEIHKYLIENKGELLQSDIGAGVVAFSYSGLIAHYSLVGDMTKSLKLQDDLSQASVDYLGSKNVQAFISSCKYNITEGFLNLNKIDQASKTNEEFQGFVGSYINNVEIQESYTVSTANLIKIVGQRGGLQVAIDVYRKLKSVTDSQQSILKIQIQVASSLVDLLANTSSDNQPVLNELHEDLQQTASLFPDEFSMQLKYARGLVNLIGKSTESNDKSNAIKFYKQLKSIASKYDTSLEIQSEVFKGSFTLTRVAKDLNEDINVLTLNTELLSHIKNRPENFEIKLVYNLAVPEVIEALCQINEIDNAFDEYNKLKHFAELNSQEPRLQLAVSRAIIVIMPFYLKVGGGDKVYSLINEMVQLAYRNPNHLDIQINCLSIHNFCKNVNYPIDKETLNQETSRNLQRIITRYAKNNNLREAIGYHQSLKKIFNEQKSNLPIALHLALATFDILIGLNENNNRNKSLESQLKTLFKSFHNSTDMIELKRRFEVFNYQKNNGRKIK